MPVESEDLQQCEGHVEGDEEEVGDAEDQDEDILRCQHHLGMNKIVGLFNQNMMHSWQSGIPT